ncbi:MAG: HAD hydrolase-like protein [Candidatus Binataceae bacterium]|nr:HAD hydrolase-like protein [Candidatus Binataceae bacterium]
MASRIREGGLNLIFDADDTLWDSNIHFLEAEADFRAALARAGIIDERAIGSALRRHEMKIIESHGYGRRAYLIALHRAAEDLAPAYEHAALRTALEGIGSRLLERPCALLAGVGETLAELRGRHRLLLFTKGDHEEQLGKLGRSGLAPLFSRVGVPIEKEPATYRLLIAQAELDPARSYMIGNSPRSDINAALAAGLGAVYIPHPHTWEMEHAEIDYGHARVSTLASFRHLVEVF